MGKYEALADLLAGVPEGQSEVELTFGRLDRLVAGLPPSARHFRTWWANNSQGQSLAWNQTGWHVRSVDLAGSRVTFARGRGGGSHSAGGRVTAMPSGAVREVTDSKSVERSSARAAPMLVQAVDIRVVFTWVRLGAVVLDGAGKLAFPGPLPTTPGLYKFTLLTPGRPRVYIGESDNLRRRLSTNYRNPGPSQRTSLRVNHLLTKQIQLGVEVVVDISVAGNLRPSGLEDQGLDFSRKAGRLLAENAALVLAQISGDVDIENLG